MVMAEALDLLVPDMPVPVALLHHHAHTPLKDCLHIPTLSPSPSQFPSKFNIMSMVMGSLTGRMDVSPILPVKLLITISIMLNFDRHCDGDEDGVITCKQTLRCGGDTLSLHLVTKPV